MVVVSRQDVHRLVDAVPEARLPVVEQMLRASLGEPIAPSARRLITAPSPRPTREQLQPCEEHTYDD
jgi:hypothetical protein